jgi:two-component system cell cycle response regulator DivK
MMTDDDDLILIVEDNSKNRNLVRDVLRYHGFRTIEADTGTQGITLALERRPRLVLLDIQLPDIDGVSVLRRLRQPPAAFTGAILALTAYAMKDDSDRFLRLGFDGYISKPIDIRDFPQQVRHYSRIVGAQARGGARVD